MTGKQAIATSLHATKNILSMYLADLSDADLLVRPVPGANHIAWQLGHLISGEPHLVRMVIADAAYPEFPAGFAQAHAPEAAKAETPQGYLKKDEYLGLFDKTRAATLAAVEKLTDADLDRPTQGKMATFAPTVGALLLLVGNHTLMHAGQFTVVRRKLGKPVVM
jgi:uncharacterized damage-inducible protein DinB